jgi:hypothetical protein
MGGVYCEDCDIAEVIPRGFQSAHRHGALGVRP